MISNSSFRWQLSRFFENRQNLKGSCQDRGALDLVLAATLWAIREQLCCVRLGTLGWPKHSRAWSPLPGPGQQPTAHTSVEDGVMEIPPFFPLPFQLLQEAYPKEMNPLRRRMEGNQLLHSQIPEGEPSQSPAACSSALSPSPIPPGLWGTEVGLITSWGIRLL